MIDADHRPIKRCHQVCLLNLLGFLEQLHSSLTAQAFLLDGPVFGNDAPHPCINTVYCRFIQHMIQLPDLTEQSLIHRKLCHHLSSRIQLMDSREQQEQHRTLIDLPPPLALKRYERNLRCRTDSILQVTDLMIQFYRYDLTREILLRCLSHLLQRHACFYHHENHSLTFYHLYVTFLILQYEPEKSSISIFLTQKHLNVTIAVTLRC